MFVLGWFINPPYGFAPEDNLAYRDYIQLHQRAEEFLEARYPMARVLTAWPASDELTRPYLGYVTRPMQVVRIEHFAIEQLMSAADLRSNDLARTLKSLWCSPRNTSRPIRCSSIGVCGRSGRRDSSTTIATCPRGRRSDPGRKRWFTPKPATANGSA